LKRKSSVLKTDLVDATKKGTKMLAESIDRIHIINIEIEERPCPVVGGCEPSALKNFVNNFLNH
jgi:hypothetical protein